MIKILVAVDGSALSLDAVHHVLRLVQDGLRASVVLANVQEPASLYELVVSGPLPVDELNKCLWVNGYVRRMFKRLATLPHGKLQRTAEPFRKAA